jgi:hypothetical protein
VPAELALKAELVTVSVPLLSMPPPRSFVALAWLRVRLSKEAWTPASARKTRLALFPSTVTPGPPPSMVTVAVLAGRLNSSWLPPSMIGPVNMAGSNTMLSAPPSCRVPLIWPRI